MTDYHRPERLGGEYGFEVGLRGRAPAQYVVQLPHSCDEWVIASSEDKATAVAEMETFIAEAQAALAKLREAS